MTDRILVVDDDEVVASTLSDVLRREGLETDAATSLSEARARVQANHFDAVLVDLLLGDEDGLQLLTTLREHSPDTVAIVLSGYSSFTTARRAIQLGVVEFLTKPVQLDELKTAVARGLAKRRAIITARQEVETERERLLQAERLARADAEAAHRHLRDLFRAAPALIAVTRGPDHVVELLNGPFADLLGLADPDAANGRPAREAFPELERAGYLALADRVYASGEQFTGREMPAIVDHDRDGVVSERWTNVVIKPYRDGDGNVAGLLFHGFDVTEQVSSRRREEEARRQAAAERAFLETAIHQIPSGVAIVEAPSFRVLLENERVFQLARVPTPKIGERLEHSVFQGYNTHGRRLREEEWPLVRAIRAGETVVGEEIELLLDDSARVTLQISAAPVRGPSGEIIAGVVTMVDATHRKRSERRQAVLANLSDELAAAQLDRSEVLAIVCRAAAAAVGEHASIHLVDPDGVTLRAAAVHDPIATRRTDRERILGAFPLRVGEGWTGRVVATGEPLFLPSVDMSLLRARTTPEHRACIERLFSHGMIVVPMRAHGKVLGALTVGWGSPGPGYTTEDLALLQDVADRAALSLENTNLYEAERQSRAAAEQALALRNEFLSVAAHELKTPLTGLRASAQLVLRTLSRTDSVDREALSRRLSVVDLQSAKLAILVNQLLDVSRIESGRLVLEPKPVDLFELIRGVATLAQSRTAAHHIQVEGESATASVDPMRIEQVLTNLLDNAIKYSPSGGDIQVELRAEPDQVTIIVADEGLGVPVEHRAHIFDRFYQAHATSHLSGLGLGLFISQQIVELHRGTIRATFPERGGTRIEVTLPIYSTTDE